MLKILRTIALTAILSASWNSQAALIQWDAFTDGDNLAVKDEATGLVWLDLTLTAGVSYDAADDLFAGWGYANAHQVESMFNLAFTTFTENSGDGAQLNCRRGERCFNQAQEFGSLFGYTPHAFAPTFHYSFGLYADNNDTLRMAGTIVQNPLVNANIYSTDYTRDYSVYRDSSFYNLATYLIQLPTLEVSNDNSVSPDTVELAEPVVSAFFAFGAALLVGKRRKVRIAKLPR